MHAVSVRPVVGPHITRYRLPQRCQEGPQQCLRGACIAGTASRSEKDVIDVSLTAFM